MCFIIEAASGLMHARKQGLRIGGLRQRGRKAERQRQGNAAKGKPGHSAFALSVATLSRPTTRT
jgi:hypothetical protein